MFIDKIRRQQIAREVISKLGCQRAKDGTHPTVPPIANKVGFAGVDYTNGSFRARIRFCNALSGKDTRITLGRFDTPAEAGFAYAAAHVVLWGSLSYFVREITAEDLSIIADGVARELLAI